VFERESKTGGLISVRNALFGLTTAHGIVSCRTETSLSSPADAAESTDGNLSASDSDSEAGSSLSSEASFEEYCPSQSGAPLGDIPISDIHFRYDSRRRSPFSQGISLPPGDGCGGLDPPKILAYSLVYVSLIGSSAVFLLMGPPLMIVRFSLSEQLLGHDFSFGHGGRGGGRGKSVKGRKEMGQKD